MWLKNKKIFLFVSAIVLFVGLVGCIRQEIAMFNQNLLEVDNAEDALIMQGYAALDQQDYQQAKELFYQAYAQYPSPSYLKEILGILALQNDVENLKKESYTFLEKYPKDETVRGVLVGILSNERDFKNALNQAHILLEYHKNAESYEVLSSVYFLHQDFKNAVKNLQLAYDLNPNEILLDKLAAIHLLFLKDKKTAIALYENHIKIYGITQNIGEKLAAIYLESKQFEDVVRIYALLFEEFGDQKYAQFILEIYVKLRRLDLAEQFLLESPNIQSRDALLFEVYRLQKATQKTIKQAEILYQNTQDLNFLAYKAMLIYESTKTRTKEALQDIEMDLKKAAEATNDALYWNYLGYLMIADDFNDTSRIREGMQYVQNALEKEGDNVYYLDSLAWGYYKLKDCAKAREIMESIPEAEIQAEEELQAHYQAILSCIKE